MNRTVKRFGAIAKVLFERRLELQAQTPLAGFITRPNLNAGTFIPVHQGALDFYNRNEPSFIVDKADFIALLVTIFIFLGSGLLGIRRRWKEKQKNTIDFYTHQLMDTMRSVQAMRDEGSLAKCILDLRGTLETVIDKLDKDEVNAEGFQFFSFVWGATLHAIEERKNEISET